MARAAQSSRWDHTSHLLSQSYNIHRGRNQPARPPRDFHPLADRRIRRGMTGEDLAALKVAFANQQTITLPPGEWLPT